jgi:transposase
VIRRTQQKPSDGSTHWSCRKLSQELGVSKSTVQRILAQAKLQPHRLDRYMASTDPEFEAKAADIIGLYVNPPQHAAVFCVDEKTAIQALDRLDPVLPLSPGRAERHGFEYYRHGTLSLYAALNVKTGSVEGKTAPRHTSAEFVGFLTALLAKAKWAREIHIVLDNLSAHKTQAVEQFLADHPKVRLHSNLFILAQSGRDLVCKNRPRCHCPRSIHFCIRPPPQTNDLYSRLCQACSPNPLDLYRSHKADHC